MTHPPLIAIIGPTASGKTTLACRLAHRIGAEIISGDSRQIYRGMTLGTGKDLGDYVVDGTPVPYHLIDICEPGTRYNVYQYQQDFLAAYGSICRRGSRAVLCGGSGLYVESVLRGYDLPTVPQNPALRQSLAGKSASELAHILSGYGPLHNTTDLDSPQRTIRAIEIADYNRTHAEERRPFEPPSYICFGVSIDRDKRRARITQRLHDRLEAGMIGEVESLLAKGIKAEDLIYYGLEYKYLTLHVIGRLSYDEMVRRLEIAIHQFAKRQMTYFRGMERRGISIHWIDEALPMEEKLSRIEAIVGESQPLP